MSALLRNYKKVILSMQKLNFAEVNTELEKTRLTLLAKTLEKIGEYKNLAINYNSHKWCNF